MSKGLLIVIEGIDGAGKTTQVELLEKYYSAKNIPHEVISFPRYEDNLYGQLIRRYLNGEFGRINPYVIALIFAGDRVLAKAQIENWLAQGKLVIANRYVSSSKAHLGANLPEEKKEEFIRWLDKLEYQTNKMPKEDLTILLDIEPSVGRKNVQGADIHESNLKHLQEASKIYLKLAQTEPNWKVVDCMSDGSMKSKEEIHKLIIEILNSKLMS